MLKQLSVIEIAQRICDLNWKEDLNEYEVLFKELARRCKGESTLLFDLNPIDFIKENENNKDMSMVVLVNEAKALRALQIMWLNDLGLIHKAKMW